MSDADTDLSPFDEPVEPGHFSLPAERNLRHHNLPADIAAFYAGHEGVGLESSGRHSLRIAKLNEVTKITWRELGWPDPIDSEWARFSGYRIGFSDFGDEIVYVLWAPGIPSGSILAIGIGANEGPAGDDKDGPMHALILSASLDAWVARMDRFGPAADGLHGDEDWPAWVTDLIEHEIAELNPFSFRAGRR